MCLSLILNSSRQDVQAIASRVDEAARRAAVELRVDICDGPSLVAAARRALAKGSRTVAAGGGDGTVSSIASVLAGTEATLGVLPLGTLNHFARDLQVPLDLDRAIATLIAHRTVRVDVGEVNGRIFINNSSVGLYPRLVWEREQRQRSGRRKSVAMVSAAWTVWRRYRRVTVVMQQEQRAPMRIRTPFVFVGNNRYELSGLEFGSRARVDEARLHVCTAPELTASEMLRVFGAVLVGRLRAFDRFESLTTRDLTIGALRPRLGVSLDGEVVVLPTPLRYRTRPGALLVAVPEHHA